MSENNLETQRDYCDAVESLAKSIIDDAINTFSSDKEVALENMIDDIHDGVHSAIDSSAYLIYTAYHLKIIEYTDNEEAYLASVELAGDFSKICSTVAYFAMEADVRDWISENRETYIKDNFSHCNSCVDDCDILVLLFENHDTWEGTPLCHDCYIEKVQEAIEDVDDLETLLTIVKNMDDPDGEIDMSDFPTFGCDAPDDTSGIWSWNDTHFMVGEGSEGLRIVERSEWKEVK